MQAILHHLKGACIAVPLALAVPAGAALARDGGLPGITDLPDALAPYPLRARGLDIQDALRLFAKNLRIGLVVDESISGEITTELASGLSREAYIDELAALHDFVWYFDGQVLRVSPVGDIEIEFIPLRDNSGATVIDMLKRLGLFQAKFTHRADPRSRMLMVSGPSSYTELVREVASAAEEAERTNITLMRGNESGVPAALDALDQIQSESPDISPPSEQD